MDNSNHSDIRRQYNSKGGGVKAKVMLFGEFSGTDRKEVIQDPYYIDGDAFEKTYEQCQRFSKNFLAATFPDVTTTTN
ncbi:hypothetical protein RRF57_010084 [Xylaria bambusicola]|uniref:Phosphotyrosine protein phosphatase I domain-containing protein n=1 Tax=Xylaria bambusicola TaxID=326684 RepID=A0AAN7Z2F0_9PEZI